MLTSDVHYLDANGIRIAYQDFGPKDAPAFVLIMGLGAQLIHWPDELIRPLLDAGYRVVRFDNRDAGLSQKLDHLPTFGLGTQLRFVLGMDVRSPYRLDDMARDTTALMDALGIERAHVAGASMGGMVAQLLAARHADRVSSMTSIMSTSGERRLPQPARELTRLIVKRPPDDRPDAQLEHLVQTLKAISSPVRPRPDDETYELARRTRERSSYADGVNRQLWAIIGSGHRAELLPQIRVPTLVVHGDRDPLVPPAGGKRTAELIPGSRLHLIDGMGHALEPWYAAEVAALMLDHAEAPAARRSA